MTNIIQPHPFAFPDAALDDLRERLSRTRWPDRETVDDWSQGAPLTRIRALTDYWQGDYDWRRVEARLNALNPSMTRIDGLDIHFLHLRSPEQGALPLVMTHGWPGSVLEFRKVIGPLTNPAAHGGDGRQAFHLVLPTLPGFGFSDKPTEPGWGISRVADAWITLMDRLGYTRWGAQGGDWGSAVTDAIGRKAPAGCVGLHFNLAPFQPTPDEVAQATPEEQAIIDRAVYYNQVLSGYAAEQATRPQTIGYSLADSPVGLAAWIYAMFQDVSDSGGDAEAVFSKDEMLDDIMLYWLPNAGASSARLYWEAAATQSAAPPPSSPVTVPAGFSMFPKELSRTYRRWAERRYSSMIHFNELQKGGHFAALEQPELFVQELQASFSHVR